MALLTRRVKSKLGKNAKKYLIYNFYAINFRITKLIYMSDKCDDVLLSSNLLLKKKSL